MCAAERQRTKGQGQGDRDQGTGDKLDAVQWSGGPHRRRLAGDRTRGAKIAARQANLAAQESAARARAHCAKPIVTIKN